MNMPQKDYYDPAQDADGRNGEGVVLKPKPFKPLKNIKTGNFFSYSFAMAEHNTSINNDPNIMWVDGAPKVMQEKINTLRDMHAHARSLHRDLIQCMKDEDKPGVRRAERAIKDFQIEIDEFIYPISEREYVESQEAKRFRLEQQNELTLDAASIAALREPLAPAGSTADVSLAQAKLEVALQKIAELESAAKLSTSATSGILEENKPAAKRPERPKVSAKPK